MTAVVCLGMTAGVCGKGGGRDGGRAAAGAAWTTASVARVEAATAAGATAGVARAVAVTAVGVTTGAVWAATSGTLSGVVYKDAGATSKSNMVRNRLIKNIVNKAIYGYYAY